VRESKSLQGDRRKEDMAYVDHAFSITDEDIMMETSYAVNNRPPIKEIALAIALLVFGAVGIIIGLIMAVNHVGGDHAHGNIVLLVFLHIVPAIPLGN
jgi:hypothetical protein